MEGIQAGESGTHDHYIEVFHVTSLTFLNTYVRVLGTDSGDEMEPRTGRQWRLVAGHCKQAQLYAIAHAPSLP